MKKTIFVEATFQIVAAIKGQVLAYPQTIIMPVDLSGPELEQPYGLEGFKTVFFHIVEAAILVHGTDAFIKRLKAETALKRKVGGTKWKVECKGGIEMQPLYLKEAKVGDFFQFLKGKKIMRWDDEKKVQYSSMIYPDLTNQIVDRNMALVKQLYDAAIKSQYSANDDQEKKAA